jgi:uncharacterized protein (TIGR02271 family)
MAINSNSLTALFRTEDDAQDAVDALIAAGVPQGSIRLLPGNENDGDIRPASGEVHQGFWQSLTDFFMPNEDRYSYAEGLSRGGYLVAVTNLDQSTYGRALDILDREGAVDLEQEEQAWRSTGWSGYEANTAYPEGARADLSTGRSDRIGSEDALPVVEEQLRVGKRDVSHGRVRVRSYVVETPVEEQLDLREENVRVERRPVDRPLAAGDEPFRDRVIEVEERAEEPVVEKTARVVEEVALSKQTNTRHETVSDTVKRTEVEVEDERGIVDRTGTSTGSRSRS